MDFFKLWKFYKILNNEKVDDIDLSVNVDPQKVIEILEKNNIKYLKIGIEHERNYLDMIQTVLGYELDIIQTCIGIHFYTCVIHNLMLLNSVHWFFTSYWMIFNRC